MIQTLKIGYVSLKNNLILAPMAGVTDLPFRLLCKEQGAGLLCMEMVSAKAIYFNNKNTEELLTIDDREPPVSLQLFGSDPDIISEMAKKIENRPFSIPPLAGLPYSNGYGIPVDSKSHIASCRFPSAHDTPVVHSALFILLSALTHHFVSGEYVCVGKVSQCIRTMGD